MSTRQLIDLMAELACHEAGNPDQRDEPDKVFHLIRQELCQREWSLD